MQDCGVFLSATTFKEEQRKRIDRHRSATLGSIEQNEAKGIQYQAGQQTCAAWHYTVSANIDLQILHVRITWG